MFRIKSINKEKISKVFKKAVAEVTDCSKKSCKILSSGCTCASKHMRKVLVRAKDIKMRVIATALSTALFFSAAAVVYATEQKSAVDVRFLGRHIGYVADMKTATAIADTVCKEVHGELSTDSFSFTEIAVSADILTDADSAVRTALNSSDVVVTVCGLYVDGVLTAVAEDFSTMQAVLSVAAEPYTTDGAVFVGYANSVVLRDISATVEFAAKKAVDADTMRNGAYGVQVLTCRTEEYEDEVVFEETVVYNENKYTDYKKVTQKGKNGLRSVVAHVTYVNGEKYAVSEIESVTITAPVNSVTVVGTQEKPVSYNGYVLASSIMTAESAEFVFPVECEGETYISSFWGDGRGHQGIDIAAPKGNEIYAAANGTVSFAGYKSDYGYYIVIDHYDGKIQTLYSHNAKNLVKEGDEVVAGQLIAKVGITGNATGNHLHFSVIVNGKMVDPAPYVGLR